MDQSDDADRFDVLSADEEGALCLVRQIVAGARARGMATDIEALGRAVIEAGASRQGDEAGRELSTFRLRGARFSLAAHTQPGAGIEINFNPGPRCD